MILLRLSTVVNDVTVEIEGEADSLIDIQEVWESFVLSTYQVEHGSGPSRTEDLYIHQHELTKTVNDIIEVL